MQTRSEYVRVAMAALIGAVAVVMLLAVACAQVTQAPTPIPAATVAPDPTATTVPTSTPVPTATPLPATAVPSATNTPVPTPRPSPTSTPVPTATPVQMATPRPTSTPPPTRGSVVASPTPEPTMPAAATAEPTATVAPVADVECPTPEQEAYIATVDGHFGTFTEVLGNVAADWFALQDDMNLIFGDEFKANGKESVMQLRELAADMRAGDAPESMMEIEALVVQIAEKSEGYAASLEPLYDLAPGTPGVDLLLDLALASSAAEIQAITEIGLKLTNARAQLCE